LTLTPIPESKLPDANEEYLKIEKENKGSQEILAVLVSVESMRKGGGGKFFLRFFFF